MGDINLTFHITSPAAGSGERCADPSQFSELVTYAGFEKAKAAILQKCEDLGDPGLYLPFIKSAYGADRLDDLKPDELGRLEWWLGIRALPPK